MSDYKELIDQARNLSQEKHPAYWRYDRQCRVWLRRAEWGMSSFARFVCGGFLAVFFGLVMGGYYSSKASEEAMRILEAK